ncbi:MAG TPA: OmpA family protein, partial [Devosia sp.]|nr:OmpA family protein [Devosia sp.]
VAQRNAIVFQPGKAALVASSMPVLDELAGDLNACPDTDVHVQGHTDSDGDPDANLALSVARAEAVVAELVKRGVADSRLYAEGYGETDPIASNDTKDGKARNRRIAFELTQE